MISQLRLNTVEKCVKTFLNGPALETRRVDVSFLQNASQRLVQVHRARICRCCYLNANLQCGQGPADGLKAASIHKEQTLCAGHPILPVRGLHEPLRCSFMSDGLLGHSSIHLHVACQQCDQERPSLNPGGVDGINSFIELKEIG